MNIVAIIQARMGSTRMPNKVMHKIIDTPMIKILFDRVSRSKKINKIILATLLSILVAASTAAIAWLLDPAIKKIFIEKDKTFILIIP